MPTLADYLKRTSERRQLRRTVEGPRATYRILLEGNASITVMVDELDPTAFGRVTSEAWPVPVTSGAYVDFMKQALAFNRNALHHLPCGIVQDTGNTSLYRLTWMVASLDQPDEKWRQQLKLFGTLVTKAWETMPVPGQGRSLKRTSDEASHVIFMP